MKRFLRTILFVAIVGLVLPSCRDLFSSADDEKSFIGTWGMVSGGIKTSAGFTALETKEDSFYKTMDFSEDGSFIERCGDAVAYGAYEILNGQTIQYTYTTVYGTAPEYFVVHRSGSWLYYFMNKDSFMLYDYASSTHEVSMRFVRIQ